MFLEVATWKDELRAALEVHGGNGAFMELSELSVEQVHFGYSVGCVCVCVIFDLAGVVSC